MSDNPEILSAFTADQVTHLTGLSSAQLRYWDATGFFEPQYASTNRRSPYSRMYSFKDVVGLRTLAVLKNKHGVSLAHLRQVAEKLASYSKTPWSDIKLKVWNRRVQFVEPSTGKTVGVVDGQYFLLEISGVMDQVRHQVDALKHRDDESAGQIEKRRYVAHSAPVLAGTRIKVSTVVAFLEAGYTSRQIVDEYPILTEKDVEAVRHYRPRNKAA